MKNHRRLASIDIGTNSVRLLVADCDGRSTRTLDRRMVITRLGEGVDSNRSLKREAIYRTLEVLNGYAGILRDLRAERVFAAATSAARDSDNGEEFLSGAERALGERPEVLTGPEEALASLIGALSDLEDEPGVTECDPGHPVLVFDIGGGSTELIATGRPRAAFDGEADAVDVRSLDVGCVRMSERYLNDDDPPTEEALSRLEAFLTETLEPVLATMLHGVPSLGVGLAGTVTTVSAMKQGLRQYDADRIHHSLLGRYDVEKVFIELASVPIELRKQVMGLEPGRADVIVGGVAVLRSVMDLSGLGEIIVSEKDILDGLVIELYRGRR